MGISKDKLQKMLAQEKKAREERDKLYEQIIFEYDHIEMELSQEKRKFDRLKLKEYEYLEYIDQLKKENDRLNKELNVKKKREDTDFDTLAKKQQIADTETSKALAKAQEQNKMSLNQIKEMEGQIKKLREKLGNTTIPLKSLADGLKRYAAVHGLAKGKDLLLSLCYLLQREHVWTDNVESLEDFFIAAEEENKKALLSLENKDGGIIQITEINEKE